MVPRIIIGKGVSGISHYVLGQGRGVGNDNLAPREESRVAWIGGQSFGFAIETRDDADLARRIMEFDALNQTSPTRKCEKDAVHLMLAWRTGEEPGQEEMEAAARSALKALGMENAKAIWAAHSDEEHAHLHIVASKLDPDTGRAYNLKANYLKLSKWAERYEREHGGVVCLGREAANGLRDAIDARDAGAVLEGMTKQRATFTADDLERALGKQIAGELDLAQFGNDVLSHPEVVRLADSGGGTAARYTTKTVLEAEQYVLRATDGLARVDRHEIGYQTLGKVTDRLREEGRTLSGEQLNALHHATRAGGLALIDGQAGSGKSHTIRAIRTAYESEGCEVIGLTPTHAVAQDMARDGFSRAGTIHSELFALANGRRAWTDRTVVVVDEAAMVDTKLMALIATHAHEAGAKLILAGDDRQLASIERGGMFGALKDRHEAAALTEVRRQHKEEDRRAASMMAEGNFSDALQIFAAKDAIHWSRTQDQARAALVEQWAKDSAAEPDKSRFVFAYTNAEVALLNTDIRAVRRGRGELGEDRMLDTADGKLAFAAGDRVQFTGTAKPLGLYNGAAGTITAIDGSEVTVQLDGRKEEVRRFDTSTFQGFRHGYAGTVYKGQGRTLDQTYLYHSEHWRSAASYVALTRHRDKTELYVATNTARDLGQLARQMARVDDRRAASQFQRTDTPEPVRPLTANEIAARFALVRTSQPAGDTRQPGQSEDKASEALRARIQDIQERQAMERGAVQDIGRGRSR